jgi:tRNA threonylcarbamoyl adenosine modification protein YeaZ
VSVVLAIDTATTEAIVALGTGAGSPVVDRWPAGYRHGEELLVRIEALLHAEGVQAPDLAGLVVGTGPGAFTGLRVGIATAKGLSHALGLPIAGVSTAAALLRAAAASAEAPGRSSGREVEGEDEEGHGFVLLLPAGPADRVMWRPGAPARIVPGGSEPELQPGELLVALDLDGRAPAEACARGELARSGLAAAMLSIGAPVVLAGPGDDLARLVPEYVTLPRGVRLDAPDDAVRLTGHGVA